jgi:hypothetical protein
VGCRNFKTGLLLGINKYAQERKHGSTHVSWVSGTKPFLGFAAQLIVIKHQSHWCHKVLTCSSKLEASLFEVLDFLCQGGPGTQTKGAHTHRGQGFAMLNKGVVYTLCTSWCL